jgi:ABC-type bacteriocin/lantibiotic exporter with double-glycine peptidase domain
MLPVPHKAQQNESSCLPGCAQMVLSYLGKLITQDQLIRLLGTSYAGTPFSRLRLLTRYGVSVKISTNGTFSELRASIDNRVPVIVAVHAAWLSETPVETQHALVVIGLDDHMIQALDPAIDAMPLRLTEVSFLSAWTEMDCLFAIIAD